MLSPNAIFQVLVTSGNKALATVGDDVSKILPGQLGVYDADTNVAVDKTTVLKSRNLYMAVGIGTAGATASEDIRKSAGQVIQKHNNGIKLVTARCYTPPQPQIVDITDFFAYCETEYSIKFRFENQSAFSRYGFTTPAKTFSIYTSCCAIGCDTTCKNFAAEAAYLMVQEINKDDDKLLTAELIDYTTDPDAATVVELEDYQDWVDDVANADKGLGIRVTTHPTALQNFAGINLGYEFPRGTHIITSLIGGFNCNGKVTETQSLLYEEGAGYDVQQLEYFAGGWNASPGIYRQSGLFGLQKGNIVTFANPSGRYVMINWNYYVTTREDRSYEANTDTIVAIPCGETTTINPFADIIDAIMGQYGGFDALKDDLTACPACAQATPAADLIPHKSNASYVLDGIA